MTATRPLTAAHAFYGWLGRLHWLPRMALLAALSLATALDVHTGTSGVTAVAVALWWLVYVAWDSASSAARHRSAMPVPRAVPEDRAAWMAVWDALVADCADVVDLDGLESATLDGIVTPAIQSMFDEAGLDLFSPHEVLACAIGALAPGAVARQLPLADEDARVVVFLSLRARARLLDAERSAGPLP